jgi:hypothetical protein
MKGDISIIKRSQYNKYNDLNLTQIDEYKNKGNFNLGNQEKLNDLYLKKVKSSKNLANIQNNISSYKLNQTNILNQKQIPTKSKNKFNESTSKKREIELEKDIYKERDTENNNYLQYYSKNMSTYTEGRSVYLNFGRLCDVIERERDDRSQSPKLINNTYINQNNINNISQNKTVIRNIELNVIKFFKKIY